MARKKFKPGRKNRPCKINYNSSRRWLLNKVKKLARHIKNFPSDATASKALDRAKSKANASGVDVASY